MSQYCPVCFVSRDPLQVMEDRHTSILLVSSTPSVLIVPLTRNVGVCYTGSRQNVYVVACGCANVLILVFSIGMDTVP